MSAQTVPLGRVGLWTGLLNGLDVDGLGQFAREVEGAGYGTLWFGETPVGREALTQALLLLEATERLTVATGIANVYLRDASAAVAASRAIGARYPGRFVLGLGASHAPLVEGLLGKDYGGPLSTMRAYLEAMAAARSVTVEATEPAPPVLLAALGPKMLELSRTHAQGAHPYLVTPEHTRRAREILGGDRLLAVEQAVALTSDRAEALRRGRAHLEIYKALPNYRNNWLRLGFSEEETEGELSERLVEALVAWGDEEAIAARVAEHHAAGADHVCLQVLGERPTELARPDILRLASLTDG